MRDQECEGFIRPEREATIDQMAIDENVSRQDSFEIYVELLQDACQCVGELYFNVPLVTEIADQREFKSVAGYRERVYCYELYHQQRLLMEQRGLHEKALLLNAETDKSGTIYRDFIGARKPDFVLHRPGEGTHNIATTEVKPFSANLNEIEDDFSKLKGFLDPTKMNYFGAVSLIFGNRGNSIEDIERLLWTHFGGFWPPRFKALWHRTAGSRPVVWNHETGKFGMAN